MALGDLSSDQQRYAGAVAAGTGLDATVVRAWIGAESGWGVTKAGHNYLNIGPGRVYGSTDEAAAAVARLLNTSSYYAAVRAAIPAGPVAQVDAIQASPWDAAHYGGHRLADVYRALIGAGGDPVAAQPAALVGPGGIPIPTSPGDIADWFAGPTGKIVSGAIDALIPAAFGIVFTLAAFGLIALGFARLTDRAAPELYRAVSGAVGTGTQAAKLAAVV